MNDTKGTSTLYDDRHKNLIEQYTNSKGSNNHKYNQQGNKNIT